MTFSMLINTVGDRRQHDTYLDKLTQLKQAYFTWQAAEAETPTPAAKPTKPTKPTKTAKRGKAKPKPAPKPVRRPLPKPESVSTSDACLALVMGLTEQNTIPVHLFGEVQAWIEQTDTLIERLR